MSGDEWPADPTDPRCPECDGPVSATAGYCLHCESDLPSAGRTERDVFGSDDDAGDAGTADAFEPTRDGEPTPGGSNRHDGTGSSDEGDHPGLLHPDGLADDVSTVVVGAAGGLAVAVLPTILAAFASESARALAVGLVLWAVAGLYVAYTRTVFGAVRKAAYLLAAMLAALPLFWFTPPVNGGTFGGRVLAFAVTELVVVPFALLPPGVGYRIGAAAPDDPGP